MACYGDSFTFLLYMLIEQSHGTLNSVNMIMMTTITTTTIKKKKKMKMKKKKKKKKKKSSFECNSLL
jgi:hypothetical protein